MLCDCRNTLCRHSSVWSRAHWRGPEGRTRGRWVTHVLVAGKSVNNKDTLEDKKDESELWEAQAAFLGPNLWDKTLPYDPDLKVHEVSNQHHYLLRVVCLVPCSCTPNHPALGNHP